MSTTEFYDGRTPIVSSWLNEVDQVVHDSDGAAYVDYTPTGVGAVVRDVQSKLREVVSVKDFGAAGVGDESSCANAVIAEHNYLYVPAGFTLTCKNIQLFDDTEVLVEGTLKLPNSCSDFDRLLYATTKSNVKINIKNLDGNYANQSGNIGTHLIYLTNCISPVVNVNHGYDHYISSGATMPSVDGIRNVSSGPIFLYQCSYARVNVGLFDGWGREAIYLQNCTRSEVSAGHIQGKYLTEYSGVQVSGSYNKITRASVDFAGASAVGFDTQYGHISNIIATNTRANSGVNFGHTGNPATGSVADNIVVDGSFGAGITVAANSANVSISNFSVQNTGDAGIQFSDGSTTGKLSNGVVSYPAKWNLVAGAVANIQATNVKSDARDAATLLVNVTGRLFVAGETVTSIGGSADIRKAVQNLTGTQQLLYFTNNTPASYGVGNSITSTGGSTGTIATINVPSEYSETGAGIFTRDPRYYPGTGNQIRFPDGTAIYTWNIACAYTGAGTEQVFTQAFFSNVIWASAPLITATISSFNSTAVFDIKHLVASANTTDVTVRISATVNQTYGCTVIAIGRWK